ncbi:sugar ABC transporter ATP-binding protein [Shinella sp.]|uniref:sugar ABC transporter ATP-binding protein n=1 Tax=Shinella sp. TaxID=1870904 RepID=UPI0029A91990|nr:sugar ABC transporter ATP-binding protein [Shinella sp.]MDX3974936.1 sugar ABC transporter ATP-binding protein [Shinella sp.]
MGNQQAAQTAAVSSDVVLSVEDISKRFGGTRAVSSVSFDVRAGEIVALLGENGAGKSTLIKMLAGVYRPDSGTFRFRGEAFNPQVSRGNIAFIHQDLGLVDWMTVAENISLMHGDFPRRFGLIDWTAAERKARDALAIVSASIDPNQRVQHLSRTEKSLVAIARALARDATLLVLDEPTASLPQSEVDLLHDVLRRLRARGVAMIYVSHRLDEVFAIADRVIVLRDGFLVADEPVAGLSGDRLVQMIIGRELKDVFARPPKPLDAPDVLRVERLVTGEVGPVSLDLRAGEIVGLVGLRGAGQDAVGRALFGLSTTHAGEVLLSGGKVLQTKHPRDSVAQGLCMVAGDRNAESVAQGMSVQENLFLNPGLLGRGPLTARSAGDERAEAEALGRRFDIRPNNPSAPIETLSGGNQQKVVMARWLTIGGKVLVLEDPTAGVDVGSKADIYALLAEALKTGLGVLLISTDFEEIAALCHRAYVFRDGRIVAEKAEPHITITSLLNAASLAAAPHITGE